MSLYEHVYIARQDVSSGQVETLTEEFKALIEQGGGSVGKTEYWGLRSLQYKMKKNRKGHYVLMNIDAPSDAVQELERQMRIHDDILRYITIRVDEHETEPSVQMQSRGREDRRPRDGDRDRPPRDGDRPPRDGDRPPREAAAAAAPAAPKTED